MHGKYDKCDDKFKITHKEFETPGTEIWNLTGRRRKIWSQLKENMFLVYAYCINQRAEKATHNDENNVYMRIYKIGQSAQKRDLIAVELWVQEDEDR